jgi:hypothetical protein
MPPVRGGTSRRRCAAWRVSGWTPTGCEDAERSLSELARREQPCQARISRLVRQHPTTSFTTVNHPVNGVVTELARQLLAELGFADADRARELRQSYLDHTRAPMEPDVVRALGGEPSVDEDGAWITPAGSFGRPEVVAAHLSAYAADPRLLAGGLTKHAARLEALADMWSAAPVSPL